MIGSYIYYRTINAGWQFAIVTHVGGNLNNEGATHTLKLIDIGRNINVKLDANKLTTDDLEVEPGTWCYHYHIGRKSAKIYFYELE